MSRLTSIDIPNMFVPLDFQIRGMGSNFRFQVPIKCTMFGVNQVHSDLLQQSDNFYLGIRWAGIVVLVLV